MKVNSFDAGGAHWRNWVGNQSCVRTAHAAPKNEEGTLFLSAGCNGKGVEGPRCRIWAFLYPGCPYRRFASDAFGDEGGASYRSCEAPGKRGRRNDDQRTRSGFEGGGAFHGQSGRYR